MARATSQFAWEELLGAADADTSHFSFSGPFTNHWAIQEVVRRIKEEPDCDFIERIAGELRGESSTCHHWAYTILEIYGELPEFPEEVQGRMPMVNKILVDWLEEKDYIK